jgi:hypothetical protein
MKTVLRIAFVMGMLPLLAAVGPVAILAHKSGGGAPITYCNNTIGGSTTSGYTSGQLYGCTFTTGTDSSGYAPTIWGVHTTVGAGAADMQLGIYAGTTSGTLACHSGDLVTTGGWVTGTPPTCLLSASTVYTIYYNANGSVNTQYSGSGNAFYYTSSGTYGTWPSSITGNAFATYNGLSIYVTVQPQ